MKKTVLATLLLLSYLFTDAQFIGTSINSFVPGDFYSTFYVTNSPMNTIGNRKEVIEWKDSANNVRWYSRAIKLVTVAGQTAGSAPGNLVWLDPTDSGRIKVSNTLAGSVISNSLGFTPGDLSSTGSYSNPSWINSLAWSKITGVPAIYNFTGTTAQYTRGDGTYATFPTTVSAFTNDVNYVTSSSLTTTLGGYATSSALTTGLAAKENSITAGTSAQYWRGDKTWQTLNTSVVPEGTNLYYAQTRFDNALAAKTTSSLTEGSNLYYTQTRFDNAFAGKTTTGLAEGTNLYYTQTRFDNAFIAKSTTNLAEGTNLYFTNARARSAISLTTTGTSGAASYNSSTGVLNIPNYAVTAASSFNNTPSRTIGTSFQISTTRNARVSYTVQVVTQLALLNLNAQAQVFLEISPDNVNWSIINGAGPNRTLSVAISLGLNETMLLNIAGSVPAGYWCRLRGVTAGTGSTVAFSSGQEEQYN